MNLEHQKHPQYVKLQDGRTVLDLYEVAEDTALFSYIMENPRHREVLEALVDARDTTGLYKFIDSLDGSVLSNGSQRAYVADVFRDCVFQKYPQEKEKYQKLKDTLNGSSDKHLKNNLTFDVLEV